MQRKGLLAGAAVVAVLGLNPQTAEAGCFGNVSRCFRGVTTVWGFWDRFFAAMDCELDFVQCVRIKIIGL